MRFRRWSGLINIMVFYTFGFAVAMFRGLADDWLNPFTGISVCFVAGIAFEQLIHSERGEFPGYDFRITLADIYAIIGYVAAPMLVCWYNVPQNVLVRMGETTWFASFAAVLGILIYLLVMARAVVVYRKWLSATAH